MKKLILIMLLAMGLSVSVFGKNYNIPKGSYVCHIVALADENWNNIFIIPADKRKATKFDMVLDNYRIVDGAGLVLNYYSTNDEGTNTFIDDASTSAVFLPKKSKISNNKYYIGLSNFSKKGNIIRYKVNCIKN